MIWLASYPRSGNTWLRTLLWQAFGLHSGSVYPNDFGQNRTLERACGHIEHNLDGTIQFPPGAPVLIKTHGPPTDSAPAIFIVRDPRAACVSLWEFYGRQLPLEAVITGQHRFGTWSRHLRAWCPWERPNTLLIKYEAMSHDLGPVLKALSNFLGRRMSAGEISSRNKLARADGRWIRVKSDWRSKMTDAQLALCNETNSEMIEKMNYVP